MTVTIRMLAKDETTFDLANTLDAPGALTEQQRWTYYISTYTTMDPTEGVPRDRCHPGVLMRNLGAALKHNNGGPNSTLGLDFATLSEDEARRLDRVRSSEMLSLRISPVNYTISWDTKTNAEWWLGGSSLQQPEARPSTEGPEKGLPNSNGSVNAAGDAATWAATDAGAGATGTGAHLEAGHDHDHEEHGGRDGEFDEKFVMNSRWMAGLTRDAVDGKNTEYRTWRGIAAPAVVAPAAA